MTLEGAPPDADDPNLQAPQEPDRLERVTNMLRRVRDLRLQAEDWEARRKAANTEINDLTFKQLPDLLMQPGMPSSLVLPPEGNLPGFKADLKPYHKAVISAEWPPEKQEAGYTVLRELNGGDLVRNTVTVEFGKGEDSLAWALCQYLERQGFVFSRGQFVPWNTLTSWLREQYLKLKKEFTPAQLEAIGATVGHVVEVKQVK